MPIYYRRPGVYLEESLLVNPADTASTFTVAVFVGAADQGPLNAPTRVDSWSDYVTAFGGFDPIQPPPIADPLNVTSSLGGNTFANLAALKADPTYGDAHYPGVTGAAMTPGQYVILGDNSRASSTKIGAAAVWVAGPMSDVSLVNVPGFTGTLAQLKAHATFGDTHYNGPAFTPGQYVVISDAPNKAYTAAVGATSSWVTTGGGVMPGTPAVTGPSTAPKALSYLPFAVYSFFQNGGRTAYIVRAGPVSTTDQGMAATVKVNGVAAAPLTSFAITALSTGTWGNSIKYNLATQSTIGTVGDPASQTVFALQVLVTNSDGFDEVVETFGGLSVTGSIAGTRRVDATVNDPSSGSQYISISQVNESQPAPVPTTNAVPLAGGIDPKMPAQGDLVAAAAVVDKVEGPIIFNIVGYHTDMSKIGTPETVKFDSGAANYISATVPSATWPNRSDIFVLNDSAPPRKPNESSSSYKAAIATILGANSGDSYCASYAPWLIVPHPSKVGTTVEIPPGGAAMGVTARIDATVGVFRAPAGVIAGVSNGVGVSTKFTDTEQGDLNAQSINVIRSVTGAGICVMGARTRKTYGADRYVSARRTLIFIKEVMKRSTQFAVFENNDQRLWSALTMAADRILRPLWEAGGLKGASSAEAYYIRCDDTINTPAVIASGEVRMEIGVALQYPAEFVVIRLTQFDQGTFTTEVQPSP